MALGQLQVSQKSKESTLINTTICRLTTSGDLLKTSMLKVALDGQFLKLLHLEELISKVTCTSPKTDTHPVDILVMFKLMARSLTEVNNNLCLEILP